MHIRHIITELLQLYFPGIASLYTRNNEFWSKQSKGKSYMDFGLFFNLAINVDMGPRVLSVPHKDIMNIAFGACVIVPFGEHPFICTACCDTYLFVIGFFPHHVMAWLVNHEAQVIIQLPPMVPYFCLSSLITHYNLDRHRKFMWAYLTIEHKTN